VMEWQLSKSNTPVTSRYDGLCEPSQLDPTRLHGFEKGI
jgi:hypothetical protein